jgi:hypothetical protein
VNRKGQASTPSRPQLLDYLIVHGGIDQHRGAVVLRRDLAHQLGLLEVAPPADRPACLGHGTSHALARTTVVVDRRPDRGDGHRLEPVDRSGTASARRWEYGRETHYLRVFINRLRHKIEDAPSHPRTIIAEPGVGYRLVTPS